MMMDAVKALNKYIFVGAYGKIMYATELRLGDPITIIVLGSMLNTSADQGKPYIEKGTTYVPLKIIGQALGYSILWDQKTREILESLGYKVNYERTDG